MAWIIVSIIVLGILIFVHELGHFLVAKARGVGVVEFSIGFGTKIWSKIYGETTYSLRLIPLGGYVRMIGDDPHELEKLKNPQTQGGEKESESSPPRSQEEELQLQRLQAEQGRWFLKQRYFTKAAIVIAGPAFNLLFAIILATFATYIYGKTVTLEEPIVGKLIPGYPAEKAGLKPKDRVLAISGVPISTWDEMAERITSSGGQGLILQVKRPPQSEAEKESTILEIKVSASEEQGELAVLQGSENKKSFKIGIWPEIKREPATFTESTYLGFAQVGRLSILVFRSLGGMIRGAISPRNLAGPIGIVKGAADSAKEGIGDLLDFMVFLSVSLAILNLLPIPILDGGHLLFFTIEAIRGVPLSLRVQELAQQIGMLFLFALMLFALGNDLTK